MTVLPAEIQVRCETKERETMASTVLAREDGPGLPLVPPFAVHSWGTLTPPWSIPSSASFLSGLQIKN